MQPRRDFTYPNADGRILHVRSTLIPGREGPVFSVEGSGRNSQEEILDAAPAEVADDMRALVAMAGRGPDGRPHNHMQAALDLRLGRVHDALWELRGSATLDELLAISDACEAAFADKGSEMFTDAEGEAVEAARQVASADDALGAVPLDAPDRDREAALGALHGALVAFDHLLVALPRREAEALNGATTARLGRLGMMGRMHHVAREIAVRGRLPDDRRDRLGMAVEKRFALDAFLRFVDDTLAARWVAEADAAMEALRRPDFITDLVPAADAAPTADAFSRANRLDLNAFKPRPARDEGGRTFDWTCRVTAHGHAGPTSFTMVSRLRPTWADVATRLRDEPGHPVAATVAGVLGDDLARGLAATRERIPAAEADAPGFGM